MERKQFSKFTNNLSAVEDTITLIDNMDKKDKQSLKGDRINVALLFFLYTLQGIPLGLSAAIPMMLQNRGISYKQQAEFSFVNWPFSLKLLWAPVVDCIFSTRFGRRKSWLIPTQYLIGAFMLLLSSHVDQWLGSDSTAPNVAILTVLFFTLNFLAATQDVAVDGWALTMLKKQNVGYASTCNSVGQTAGFFLSFILFMALESPEFCNNYLRSTPQKEGIVTLAGFLYFWGWIFITTTTLVALFKKEVERSNPGGDYGSVPDGDLKKAYALLFQILKLGPVQVLVIILLTCKMGFSATDSVMFLKLVEAGIPKERLGLLGVPLLPLQIILPLVISKYTNGPRPLNIFLAVLPFRLLFGIIAALLVWITPYMVPDSSKGLPFSYYILLLVCYAFHQVCLYSMFVAVMAFFARISDPMVGGTYMTLLNTVCNLGGNWPATLALWFVDYLTFKQCEGLINTDNTCSNKLEEEMCIGAGGKCKVWLDGFYIETVICIIIGFIWFSWGKKKIKYVQSLDEDAWKVSRKVR